MSALPLVLDGSKLDAVVIGGGRVALRKVKALLDGGARVTAVARDFCPELLALTHPQLTVTIADYSVAHIGDAMLVVAATDDPSVNARVARDATAARRLVNVTDAPERGTFTTPAVHRRGGLTIAVSTGRLPGAAAAIRNEIAERFDDRYARAIAELKAVRAQLLDAGKRDAWNAIAAELLDDEFCDTVESGSLESRIAAWR